MTERKTVTPLRAVKSLPNRCPDGEVLDRIAAALETGNETALANVAALQEVAAELKKIAPLAEGVTELNHRLTKLCAFISNNRLKIMAGILALASTPGFLAPEIGNAIKTAVEAYTATG